MESIGIHDIPGFCIGQVTDAPGGTGCTVIISADGAACGVDVRGGSPGTRDTDALDPMCNREVVHAVVLAGGSSFGLDAAGGVMRFLEQQGIGRDVGVTKVPNVCSAILFDLASGSSDARPDFAMGYKAAEAAFSGERFQSGNYGAGTGATVGNMRGRDFTMKGGIGAAAYRNGELMVGAIIAVNCVGDVVQGGRIIAGALCDDRRTFADSESVILADYQSRRDLFSGNTIIGCVITNAKLSKSGAKRLALHGHDGIARVVSPAHSIYDGDTIFAMCTGEVEATRDACGILVRRAVEAAIIDAVVSAKTAYGFTAAEDVCDFPFDCTKK